MLSKINFSDFFSKVRKQNEEQESICRHCGKLKEEVIKEETFKTIFVCYRCESLSDNSLSIRRIGTILSN